MKPTTPLPWEWWTSNSFKRLSSGGKDGNVLYAYRAGDGFPDVCIKPADMEYLVHACNNYPKLVDALRDAKLQIEYLHRKFSATGSGNAVLASLEHFLRELGELE
jgi:hypothetical protein